MILLSINFGLKILGSYIIKETLFNEFGDAYEYVFKKKIMNQ